MRRAYQIAGLTFLLVAAFLGFHAYALRYFTSLGPGPGFFPVWLCALLGILALVVIVQATIASAEPLPEQFFAPRSGYVRIAAVLAALLGVTIFLPILGFRITLFAFYVGLCHCSIGAICSKRSSTRSSAVSVSITCSRSS
jgi:hypothetical protein